MDRPSLVLALLALACASCPEERSLDALDLVPSDAALVGQADVAALRRSRLFGRLMEPLEANQNIDDLGAGLPTASMCGVDLARSVDRVTFTTTDSAMSRLEFAIVLEGRLDAERILECARKRAKRAGRRLVVEAWPFARVFGSSAGGNGVVALVKSGQVVVGERRLVRKMIRQAESGGPSIRADAAVMSLITTLGTRRADSDAGSSRSGGIGVVLRPPPDLREEARRKLVPALRPLAEAELVAVGVSLRSDLAVTALARFGDTGTARRLARQARRQVDAMVDDPVIAATPFARPLESLEIEAEGRDVVVGARLTEHEIEKLASELDDLVARVRRAAQ